MEKFVYSFLKNTYLFELPTRILSVSKQPDGLLLELADSIFHPQGGGQPNDVGKIVLPGEKEFQIATAINDRETGKIQYKIPTADEALLIPGKQVLMVIDKDTRVRNAKLHSAGHLLDVAVNRLKLGWQPGKGYHFPDSPYVQYIGNCDNFVKAKEDLQRELDMLINSSPMEKVHVNLLSVEEARDKKLVDESFKGKDVRMVDIMGVGCPCAGTHVQMVSQIGKVEVSKIAKKGKNLRVSYVII